MNPKQKTAAMILSGALVAMAPSFFGYLQARQEIKEKYNKNRAASEAGYTALVDSVESLQKAVTAQHQYIVKLEGQIDTLTELAARPVRPIRVSGRNPASSGDPEDPDPTPTGAGHGTGSGRLPAPRAERPPAPNFQPPPPDLAAAQQMERPPLD